MKKPKVVIVMPTYKEAANIGKMIDELGRCFTEITGAEMHLLIVNDIPPDGSPDDGTGGIVRERMKKYQHLHIIEAPKKGLGWAYIRGMKYAVSKLNADAVMEMDADFQHPPRFVKPMVQAFLDGADYVIGSRYIPGGSVPKEWGITRKAMSYFGNLYIRIVLFKPGLHDLTTGFRLTKIKGVLEKIDLDNLKEPHRFAYKVDLLYQSVKNAKKTVEVPLEFAPRTEEESKFSLDEMVSTFILATVLGIKDKKRLIKFGIVGFIGFMVNFVFIRIFRGMGLPEILVWLFATELAIVNNFIFNNLWTFKEKQISGTESIARKFLQFNATSAGALAIQSIFGPLGVMIVGEQYDFLVLAFVVVLMVMPYNYFMYNVVIWRTWKLPFLSKLRTR